MIPTVSRESLTARATVQVYLISADEDDVNVANGNTCQPFACIFFLRFDAPSYSHIVFTAASSEAFIIFCLLESITWTTLES